MAPVAVALRTVTGAVHNLQELSSPVEVEQLYQQAAQALGMPADRFKLVLKGSTLARAAAAGPAAEASSTAAAAGSSTSSGAGASSRPAAARKKQLVHLADADVLLVMPQRRPPSERLQRAAAEAAGVDLAELEDAAELRFSLNPAAPAWERWLARLLQDKLHAPELLLVWLFTVGPSRLALLALVLAGAKLASLYDLGPLYILAAIVATIFTHLGRKAEGEASAYSVFNPGVRRLPGQLDADVLDEQIRRGQM